MPSMFDQVDLEGVSAVTTIVSTPRALTSSSACRTPRRGAHPTAAGEQLQSRTGAFTVKSKSKATRVSLGLKPARSRSSLRGSGWEPRTSIMCSSTCRFPVFSSNPDKPSLTAARRTGLRSSDCIMTARPFCRRSFFPPSPSAGATLYLEPAFSIASQALRDMLVRRSSLDLSNSARSPFRRSSFALAKSSFSLRDVLSGRLPPDASNSARSLLRRSSFALAKSSLNRFRRSSVDLVNSPTTAARVLVSWLKPKPGAMPSAFDRPSRPGTCGVGGALLPGALLPGALGGGGGGLLSA
mmetsp:Transcript_8450/g.23763  ORF Transcript_8450/g.23763 Transcript_8450/m.23763 type:complete len:297 (-) Transcript_8450:218-1108(-)